MQNFSFLSKIVLRSPLKKTETDITADKIENLLLDPQLKEALFLASPSFYELAKKQTDPSEKILDTLYKYYSRLSNRCTPFGLFASVGTLETESRTEIHLNTGKPQKKIRYDMLFLGMLMDTINQEKSIREHLTYYPNNSMYRVLDKLRYVEFYYERNKRYHRISEVDHNGHLGQILEASRNGKTIAELCALLKSPDITLKEANNFLHGIVDAQFLVSELDATLTGEDNLNHIISVLEQSRFDIPKGREIRNKLRFLKNGLVNLEKELNTPPEAYRQLFGKIQANTGENDLVLNKLFQVDAFNPLENSTLGYDILKRLRSGISVLNKLRAPYQNANLKKFKELFLNRYPNEMIPLCQILDPDSGVSYTNISGAKTPLLNDLALIRKGMVKRKIDFDRKEKFLLKKITSSFQNNESVIQLTDKELNAFDGDDETYPDSFSVFFSLFNESQDGKILLKSVSGPSANNLIGRFGYLHQGLLDISNEICAQEQKNHPHKIIAEIIHLPEARTGNILHRKFQREYEIPYLAKSSLPTENQIPIDDLYVTVKENRVILFSRQLGKEIVPRLGNAHNYSYGGLPVYNFLCDLQNQHTSGLAFDWGGLASSFPFLPRVEYKHIVLSKAQWNIRKEDIDTLVSLKTNIVARVRDFAKRKKLPDILALVQGDNEIVINFKNDLSCSVFYTMAKKTRNMVLQEFLMKNTPLTDGYANEFIAFGTKNKVRKQEIFSWDFNVAQRSFPVGSKWMYFKLYCGASTADEVLKKAISPIIAELRKAKILDKWFFIRFNDQNGHHLKFRIKLFDVTHISRVASILKTRLNHFTEPKIVWKVEMDTYQQETQRYGPSVMDETESAFQNDSECTLAFLDMIEGDEGEKIRWLFSLLSIDSYLTDFGLTEKEKLQLLREAKDGFGSEFVKDTSTNKKVNALYRTHEKDIEGMMKITSENDLYHPVLELIDKRSGKNRKVLSKIKEAIAEENRRTDSHQIFISHIHMICNRLFLTKQREHEAVVYDLMYQYYRRNTFRKK